MLTAYQKINLLLNFAGLLFWMGLFLLQVWENLKLRKRLREIEAHYNEHCRAIGELDRRTQFLHHNMDVVAEKVGLIKKEDQSQETIQ